MTIQNTISDIGLLETSCTEVVVYAKRTEEEGEVGIITVKLTNIKGCGDDVSGCTVECEVEAAGVVMMPTRQFEEFATAVVSRKKCRNGC